MNKQKNAFTLVELIVVITILAILGTIAFISLQGYSKDARDSIRISDISNIKTSLELFHLDSGKYPLPDDNQIVDYGTEILWYQGEFGTSVISSLSRSMSEVPTDPLTDKKYIFSVANNKNEFEILSLLEGDSLTLNNLSQTNAASLVVTPKIDGTYNRVFIKTANYIVPVPSIINTEVGTATMTLDSNNISSQVINGGENIPEQGNVISNTGALTGLVLSVYTGSINIGTSNSEKEAVVQKIQAAYTGSSLANSDIYEYIVNASGEEELVGVLNTIVLNDAITKVTIIPDSGPYVSCIGVNDPTPFLATTTYGSCNTVDTIVCDGVGTGYTISACNVGTNIASTAYNDSGSYGELFQWGNNAGLRISGTSPTQVSVTATGSTYSSTTFINGPQDWNSTPEDDLWGDNPGTYIDRKGPCEIGYHVPSEAEWSGIYTAGGWGANGLDMSNILRLPMSGIRSFSTASVIDQGAYGGYWSSSPNGSYAYNMLFFSGVIFPSSDSYRANGYAVRCFKN